MMQFIKTDKAPAAIGAYAQGTRIDNTLYVSGQLPLDPQTMEQPDTIEAQTRRALENLLAIVEAAGFKKTDIVRCGIFLQNMNDFAKMNAVYGDFFKDHTPARAAVEVSRLPKDVAIEIDGIAMKQKK